MKISASSHTLTISSSSEEDVAVEPIPKVASGGRTRGGRGHVTPPNRGIGRRRGVPGRSQTLQVVQKLALRLLSQCMLCCL